MGDLEILKSSFDYYKQTLTSAGRPLADKDQADLDRDGDKNERLTLSEAASYALLRAALMGDRKYFDEVWSWTRENLQRRNVGRFYDPEARRWLTVPAHKRDHLFAWQYAAGVDQKPGAVIGKNGIDPAADADQDIAAALIMAAKKWDRNGQAGYLREARAILKDIWDKETAVVANKRIVLGGDTQNQTVDPQSGKQTYGTDPSYFRPTYYNTLFREADSDHDWRSLTAPAYELIDKAARATFHDAGGRPVSGQSGLVPDKMAVDQNFNVRDFGWHKGDQSCGSPDNRDGCADYFAGGDSFRTLFWLSLQSRLDPSDTAAKKALKAPLNFLKKELADNQTIYSGYRLDGKTLWYSETPQTLATYAVYFQSSGNNQAAARLMGRVMGRHENGFWRTERESDFYYAQNWAWFSLLLTSGRARSFLSDDALLPALPVSTDTEPNEAAEFLQQTKNNIKAVNSQDLRAEKARNDRWAAKDRATIAADPKCESVSCRLAKNWQYTHQSGGLTQLLYANEVVLWLLEGDAGKQDYGRLDQALKNFKQASPYWKAKTALVLASKMADPNAAKFLKDHRATFELGAELFSDPDPKVVRERVLKAIHTQFILKSGDQLLAGESLLYQGMLALAYKKGDEAARHFRKAESILTAFAAPDKSKELVDQLNLRIKNADAAAAEYLNGLRLAQMWQAQIGMLEAVDLPVDKKLAKLTASAKLLQAALDGQGLNGLQRLEARRLLADNLLQRAYLRKDRDEDYRPLLVQAHNLLNNISRWQADYAKAIKGQGAEPYWLGQIAEGTHLLQADVSIAMGNATHDPATLAAAVKTYREILQRNSLDPAARDHIRLKLVQVLFHQGIIQFERGERNEAFAQAHQELADLVKSSETALQAEAYLWSAKINLIEAGQQPSKAARLAKLQRADEALAHLDLGKNSPFKAATLSAARQTKGDLLVARQDFSAAVAEYRLALKLDDNNNFACLALADVLNWQKEYKEARDLYQLALTKQPASDQAKLGLAEAEWRLDPQKLSELEREVDRLIGKLPAGSPLVSRALNDLLELNSSNARHERNIVLANAVLGTKEQESAGEQVDQAEKKYRDDLRQRLKGLAGSAALTTNFKADLYLKLVESVAWAKSPEPRLADAQRLLDALPREYADTIKHNSSLQLHLTLLRGELALRQKKEAGPLLDEKLWTDILAGGESFMISRLLIDRAEVAGTLTELRDFAGAIAQLNKIMKTLEDPKLVAPQERELILARTHLGFGEIHRYGEPNLAKALEHYQAALTAANKLPETSAERHLLKAQIIFGQASLAEMEGNPDLTVVLLSEAEQALAAVPVKSQPDYLVSAFNGLHPRVDGRRMPQAAVKGTTFQGRNNLRETSVNISGKVPLDPLGESLQALNLLVRAQHDRGPTGSLTSGYVGAELNIDTLCRGSELANKPGCAYAPTLGVEARVGTTGNAAEMIMIRRPDLTLSLGNWNKYFSYNGALGLNFHNSALTTGYADFSLNWAWLDSSLFRGLRLPYLEYNRYSFAYEGDVRKRDAFGAGIKWEIPVTDRFSVTPRATAQFLRTHRTPQTPYDQEYLFGAEYGLDLKLYVGKNAIIDLGFSNQANAQYPLLRITGGLTWQF